MKKVLFIDSCIKADESRTKKIADAFFGELKKDNSFQVETVVLDKIDMIPLGLKEYKNRRKLLDAQQTDDSLFDLAKQFALADLIVIAAPFWDMSFPSKLKVYLENVAVAGITFKNTEDGNSVGICRATKLIFFTTRGMDIEDGSIMEQASPYLIALAKFFDIDEFQMVSAYGLDVHPDEITTRLGVATNQAVALANSLLQEI